MRLRKPPEPVVRAKVRSADLGLARYVRLDDLLSLAIEMRDQKWADIFVLIQKTDQ